MTDPVPPPRKTNWVPSRKAISGGFAGIGSFFIIALASYLGYPIPESLQAYIPAGITWLVYYLVPSSQADIVRNLDNQIVAMAVVDPSSPVSQGKIAAELQTMSPVKTPPILSPNDSRL